MCGNCFPPKSGSHLAWGVMCLEDCAIPDAMLIHPDEGHVSEEAILPSMKVIAYCLLSVGIVAWVVARIESEKPRN